MIVDLGEVLFLSLFCFHVQARQLFAAQIFEFVFEIGHVSVHEIARASDPWREFKFRLGYNLTEQVLTRLRMSFIIVGEDFIQIDLAVNYVCRKCGKSHTKLDYDESRFCKTCGSFLLPRFSVDNGSVKLSEKILRYQRTSSARLPLKSDDSSKTKRAFKRAAESLRQRIAKVREYEVVSETEKKTEDFEGSAIGSWNWDSEYEKALKLEKELIRKFKGKNLDAAIPGKVISNEHGDCYAISATCVSEFKKASYDESRRLIISDLKLIPGIGPARELALKRMGYTTIEELENHLLWKKSAQDFMRLMEERDVAGAQDWLWQRLPKSHPLVHYLAGLCNDQDFAIIDIETLGLSERPIVLLGIARPRKESVCLSQFLLRDIQDEPSAIWALVSQLEPSASLITYNGQSFDIPYIKQRLAYYGMNASLSNPHFDVLHFTRRALHNKLADCRLETVEKYFGIKRGINIPGALVPHFYDTYLRTLNVGPLVAIVEHNKQDLITLGNLFSRLYKEWTL